MIRPVIYICNIARENYYSELAVRYCNNKSKTWRLINEISSRKCNNKISSLKDSEGRKIIDTKHCKGI